jgi:hypothetical protein
LAIPVTEVAPGDRPRASPSLEPPIPVGAILRKLLLRKLLLRKLLLRKLLLWIKRLYGIPLRSPLSRQRIRPT